ncbi:DUF3885 domain-containing protein [Cytobacillus kochii]|uniref:DUF3885 domain-containing protein n=1 Tax=Cytobacillus kochii TaxID=859143 RepID=UPI00247FD21B|nr:DUF3885 domain-containing protein [Cytobacillus kochii]
MELSNYLQSQFPGLKLMPSIYQQWNIGIPFTFAEEIYQFNEQGQLNMDRFELVYEQATTLFKELFASEDEVMLVTNMYKMAKKEKRTRKLKVYQSHLKQRKKLYQLQVETMPYPFEVEDAGAYQLQQFSLLCQCRDVQIDSLIKAAAHEDFPLKPRFGGYHINYPDVFFINLTRDVIFFIYDDRGCEVIARNVQILRQLYEKYGNWIDEVDRADVVRRLGY